MAKDRQGGRDTKQNAFDVDIDHGLPIIDCELVKGPDGHCTRIAEQNIKSTEGLSCKSDEFLKVFTSTYVRDSVHRLTARAMDLLGELCKSLFMPCPKYNLCAALGEMKGRCFPDTATCACDRDDFAGDHIAFYR